MEEKLALTQEWDKTFPRSDRVDHRKVTFHNRYGVALAADLYAPKNASGKLPAIAVCGPFGAVKEQAAGLYAQTMAERGFLTIAFDPSFTGESGGQPRCMASPDINTEDYQAAVDFLSTREDVDPAKIGILGICGWGGLALNAAALDTRVKATAAITMYDMARIAARGYFDAADSEPARHEARRAFNAQRTLDYQNGAYALAGGVVDPMPGGRALLRQGLSRLLQDANEAIIPAPSTPTAVGTSWARCPSSTSPSSATANEIRSAVLIVHGEKAHSCYMSRDAYARMMDGNPCPENKELLIIPGAVHTDLYDRVDVIPFDKLEAFFRKYL